MNTKKLNDNFDSISLNDAKKQEMLQNILKAKNKPSSTTKSFGIYISVAAVFIAVASLGFARSDYLQNSDAGLQNMGDEIINQPYVADKTNSEIYITDYKTELFADEYSDKNNNAVAVTHSCKTEDVKLSAEENQSKTNTQELYRENDLSDGTAEDVINSQSENVIIKPDEADTEINVTPVPEVTVEPEASIQPYEETKVASGGGSGGAGGGGGPLKGGGSSYTHPAPEQELQPIQTPTPTPDTTE